MKKIFVWILILIPLCVLSQKSDKKHKSSLGIGLKAGLNFADITNASAINSKSQTGYHAGVFLDIGSKLFGSRMELLYSRQGYDYSYGSSSGSVKHDYIAMAQLLAINITRFVQVQVGMQLGYLLHAKIDSSQTTGNASVDNLLSYYNRFEYALAGGLEIHPIAGFLIGARYTTSLSDLYKQPSSVSPQGTGYYQLITSGSGSVNFKNNIIQIFIGYRF